MQKQEENLMDKIVSLCKRRGFIFPGSEIYGGLANSWDYGPLGVELKNNIKQEWWKRFVKDREDIVGIDASLIMNPTVWEKSGHLKNFQDALVECKNCHQRYRIDALTMDAGRYVCTSCNSRNFTEAKGFNLLLKTFLGPAEDATTVAYFRPETAQAMFVDFKQVLETSRQRVPFGIAQIGKAFRNEITPGNFIFRTREFEQMEIEYFIREADWEKYFESWRKEMEQWLSDLGIKKNEYELVEISKEDRAFYSKRTIDIEYKYPFGQKELYGLAYRTDYDLKNHFAEPPYTDPETGEQFWPHVIEPTWGVDRSVLAVLLSAYDDSDKEHIVLHLPSKLAPYQVAIFPLLRNKPELITKAREVFSLLKKGFSTIWDDRGNIGKRYYSQDEIGTPFCVTVDFESLNDKAVTVRDRDTMKQDRVAIEKLSEYLSNKLKS